MLHDKRFVVLLSCAAFLATSGLALAGDEASDEAKLLRAPRNEISVPRPVTDAIDPAVVALFDSYRERFAQVDDLAKAADGGRAALHEEFAAELNRILEAGSRFGFEKSGDSCDDACDLLDDGLAQITLAKSYSWNGWINDCPSSSNGSDAYVNAHNSTYWANQAKSSLCNNPPPDCDDVDDLTEARDLAFDAMVAAYDAYDLDGCGTTADDMYQAYLEAFDAYVNLHNARYYMLTDCCVN